MKKSLLILAAACTLFFGCSKKSQNLNIAVFVPGIMDNSPVYAMLAQGVTEAVVAYNADKAEAEKASLFVTEAGTNQAEWGTKITALAAEQKYDVIISSNPSLPDLITPILQQFPNQKFILLDATMSGNKNVYTVSYNQAEQAYLDGYIGGFMSKTHKLALIAAQEYPVMNNIIYPNFAKGASDAVKGTTAEFRVVGNWYDATKGAELADAVYKNGVDVILPICGGASQGVISSAVNNGIYITWFDSNGFDKAPGTVIASSVMKQVEMSKNVTAAFLNGTTEWGKADMVGIKEGYVDFIQNDPLYISSVPQDVRNLMGILIANIKKGTVVIGQ